MTRTGDPRCAVVLLSGGLDSAVVAAEAARQGFKLHALTVNYGQRHVVETAAAAAVARAQGVADHAILTLDLRRFGRSALTADIPVPKHDHVSQVGREMPVTYVPARNTIFLSLALGFAESIGASDIFIGVNAVDYSGYPDCRPAFIEAFERLAQLATQAGTAGAHIRIHAPLLNMTKGQIIRRGIELGVDFSHTHSCYDPAPDGAACGRCDSCLLRRKGFEEVGASDPVRYAIGA